MKTEGLQRGQKVNQWPWNAFFPDYQGKCKQWPKPFPQSIFPLDHFLFYFGRRQSWANEITWLKKIVAQSFLQSNPYKMLAAYFQPSWPSRPKTKGTLLSYFLKLYNFGFFVIFVGSTSSEVQHPWISKIAKKSFFMLNFEVLLDQYVYLYKILHGHCNLLEF